MVKRLSILLSSFGTVSKPRILFLGSNLNPISIGCLQQLAIRDRYEITVGIHSGGDGNAIQTLAMAWKRHGLLGVLRRISLKYRAAVRLKNTTAQNDQHHLSLTEVIRLHQLEGFSVGRVNSDETLDRVNKIQPEMIVVANFPQIIRGSLMAIPPRGVVNFHPSLLPKYRGPTPFYWIVQNQEERAGGTVHFIDQGVDTGDIIAQAVFDLEPSDDEFSVRKKSIDVGAPLLAESVEAIFMGTASRTPQDESQMSYYGFPPRGASRL